MIVSYILIHRLCLNFPWGLPLLLAFLLLPQVEMVVHPSIQPNDEAVTRVIEQVRFRISSSYSAVR